MKEMLTIKNPEYYANLFISRMPKNAKRIFMYGINHKRTIEIIIAAFPKATFVIADRECNFKLLRHFYTGKQYSFINTTDDKNDLKIILEILKMPKFDVVIMNPPYDGNLHLKILEKVIPNANKVVNICPNWFYDYKKNYNLKPNEIIPFDYNQSVSIFDGIQLQYPLAITIFDDRKDFANTDIFISPLYKIFKTKKYNTSLKDVNSINYNGTGYFVPLKLMTSYWDKNKNNILDKLGYLYNGKTIDGQYYKDVRKRNKERACGGIICKSKIEAINIANSFETTFYKAWVSAFHTNSRYILSDYPYMSDYTKPWDDKRFCEYFGITGYISDTEAEPNSEWETILKTMEKYK